MSAPTATKSKSEIVIDDYSFSFDTGKAASVDSSGFGDIIDLKGLKKSTVTMTGVFAPIRDMVPMPTFSAQELKELEEVRRAAVVALVKLESLPTTRSIYNLFKDEGITGTRRNPLDCPVSNWLESTTGFDISVQENCVGKPYSYTSPTGTNNEFQAVNHVEIFLAELPTMVQRFIAEFDAENYPEIDKTHLAEFIAQ